MSKFERYKKKSEPYIYPHKHCKKCKQMIDESLTFCSECYRQIKEKKEKKRFSFRSKKEEDSTDKVVQETEEN